MNELQVINQEGKLLVDSRQVAEMVGKNHKNLLRTITGYAEVLLGSKLSSMDFFIESTYQDSIGRTLPCYLLTRKGCDMVANKMTGEKGVLFTAAYVTKFEEMERQLSTPAISAPLALMKAHLDTVDKLASRVPKRAAARLYAEVLIIANEDIAAKFGIQDYCRPYIEALIGKPALQISEEDIPDIYIDENGNPKLKGRLVPLVPIALRALWFKSGITLKELSKRTGFSKRGIHNVMTRERHQYIALNGVMLVLREFGWSLADFLEKVEDLAGTAQ